MGCFILWCPFSDEKVPLITVTPSERMAFCCSPCRDFIWLAEHLLASPSENHRSLIKWRFLRRDVPPTWGLRQTSLLSARAWRSQPGYNHCSVVRIRGSQATDPRGKQRRINLTSREIAKGDEHPRKHICRIPALPRHHSPLNIPYITCPGTPSTSAEA